MPEPIEQSELTELLARHAHDEWGGWMLHIFTLHCHITKLGRTQLHDTDVAKWKRQMKTPYAELSESEKDSDRKQAAKLIELLTSHGYMISKFRLRLKSDTPVEETQQASLTVE